jgi:hypothetical protein
MTGRTLQQTGGKGCTKERSLGTTLLSRWWASRLSGLGPAEQQRFQGVERGNSL